MAEKTGINLYYSYLDDEFAELSLEEIGALTVAILANDCGKEIREDAIELINSDRFYRTLLSSMDGKTKRATKKWKEVNERFENSKAIKAIMKEYDCTEKEAIEILNMKKGKEESNNKKSNTQPKAQKTSSNKKKKIIYEFEDDIRMTAEYEEQYENNIMNDKDFLELTKIFDYKTLMEAIKMGNLDGWKKHYSEYISEFEEEGVPI